VAVRNENDIDLEAKTSAEKFPGGRGPRNSTNKPPYTLKTIRGIMH